MTEGGTQLYARLAARFGLIISGLDPARRLGAADTGDLRDR